MTVHRLESSSIQQWWYSQNAPNILAEDPDWPFSEDTMWPENEVVNYPLTFSLLGTAVAKKQPVGSNAGWWVPRPALKYQLEVGVYAAMTVPYPPGDPRPPSSMNFYRKLEFSDYPNDVGFYYWIHEDEFPEDYKQTVLAEKEVYREHPLEGLLGYLHISYESIVAIEQALAAITFQVRRPRLVIKRIVPALQDIAFADAESTDPRALEYMMDRCCALLQEEYATKYRQGLACSYRASRPPYHQPSWDMNLTLYTLFDTAYFSDDPRNNGTWSPGAPWIDLPWPKPE